jgi:hypothetical protein
VAGASFAPRDVRHGHPASLLCDRKADPLRTVTVAERRNLLVQRHHLAGLASGPREVAEALIALHATDPATVYLSVLARSHSSTLADVATALYEARSLVRWMAMRRTVFVFPKAEIPVIQAAVSAPLAGALRRQLVSRMRRNGTEPAIEDPSSWLEDIAARVERALASAGPATGAALAREVPDLRTSVLAGAPSERAQNVTSPLLTIMGTEGRIVRGAPTGAWTSRHHYWEPLDRLWPRGLPPVEPGAAERALAQRWLERFGPATVEDLQWWTGWSKTTTRRALEALSIEEVDLHGRPGIALGAPLDDAPPANEPVAALLPSLDPTPMGWKHRDWFLGVERGQLFDYAGNIGPTLWWDGEIIGSWAVAATGEVRTAIVADRGSEARGAIDAAAALLQDRLAGAVVTPAMRTPLERALTAGGAEIPVSGGSPDGDQLGARG